MGKKVSARTYNEGKVCKTCIICGIDIDFFATLRYNKCVYPIKTNYAGKCWQCEKVIDYGKGSALLLFMG